MARNHQKLAAHFVPSITGQPPCSEFVSRFPSGSMLKNRAARPFFAYVKVRPDSRSLPSYSP